MADYGDEQRPKWGYCLLCDSGDTRVMVFRTPDVVRRSNEHTFTPTRLRVCIECGNNGRNSFKANLILLLLEAQDRRITRRLLLPVSC